MKFTKKSLFCVMLLALLAITASLTMIVTYANNYHTVRVEYLFSNGEKAHDPYVAVFPDGADVDITVTNPILPGYKAVDSLDGGAKAALTTKLDFAVAEDHTIEVYYIPDLVSYRVRYFKQNIRDDLYTEDLSLPAAYYDRTGLTGEYPTDLEDMKFDGFTTLFHEPDFIAADGSTVFKIYYDRNYYLVDFELDGGYGVEPIYAKYGSTFNIPEPAREGYTFKGWVPADANGNFVDENGNKISDEQARAAAEKFTSGTVPAKDVYYKAYWEAQLVDYSVVYLFETVNGTGMTNSENGKTYLVVGAQDVLKKKRSGESVSASDNFYEGIRTGSNTAVTDLGKKFPDMSDDQKKQLWNRERFEFNSAISTENTVVEGDSTTRVYVYYDRKTYKQRFFYARENMDPTIPENERFELAGYTKAFSKGNFSSLTPDGELRKHLICSNGSGTTDWRAIAAEKPQIRSKYSDKIREKIYPEEGYVEDVRYTNKNKSNGKKYNYRYYYFEVETKYYENMREKGDWLIDAFEPVPLNDGSGMYAKFGAWSVEHPAKYCSGIENRTVKGIYEMLDEDLMRRYDNGTTLNYLSFWTNVKNKDWNGQGSTKGLYQFNYYNYIQELPDEEQHDTDLIRNGIRFKLHNNEIVTSYDGGASYNTDKAVKEQQTATALEGFEKPAANESETRIEIVRHMDENGNPVKIDGYTVVDVYYFYTRNTYTLKFRNSNHKDNDHTREGVYFDQSIAEFEYTPIYHNPDLVNYYRFDGWYLSPLYKQKADFSTLRMPADDMTLYAKWVPVKEKVSFYNDYSKLIGNAECINSCQVDYNTKINTAEVPSLSADSTYRLTPPTQRSTFAGWYYLDESNKPVRFDPESIRVTRELKLYAEWTSADTAEYKVTYTEKGTGVEVAEPTVGAVFVSKTKSFPAKSGEELNAEHKWVDGQTNWWPTVSSHSILIAPNEYEDKYAPNIYNFEYVRKDHVWFRVRYVDAQTKTDIPGVPTKIADTSNAIITEASQYVPGYIADRVTKSAVMSASASDDPEIAKQEELAMNTIIFYYTKNENDVLYEIDHCIQSIDGSGYELYMNETLTTERDATLNLQEVFNGSSVSQALLSNGYTNDIGKTQINGADATGMTVVADGDKLIISFFYDRMKYGYKVMYVDYEQERLHMDDSSLPDGLLKTVIYNGDEAVPVGRDVTIDAPDKYKYVSGGEEINYNRISDRVISLTIRPDNNEDPQINVIKVYYRKDSRRLLKFEIVCEQETEDDFASLSLSQLIAENQDDVNANPVVIYPATGLSRQYVFKGWYDNPKGEGNALDILDTDVEGKSYHNPEKEFIPAFPPADMTYYAVYEQVQVYMNAEIMYNDSGLYEDGDAQHDADGSVTGHTFKFADPMGYEAGELTPLDSMKDFEFAVMKNKTRGGEQVYGYEFAGWYEKYEDGTVVPRYDIDNKTGQYVEVERTRPWHFIAMFKKTTEMPYKIVYRFRTRTDNADRDSEDGLNSFIVKNTLSGDDIERYTDVNNGVYSLSDAFIIENAPYESNYAETLYWSDKNIVKTVSDDGELMAIVTAEQNRKKVTVKYRLDDFGAYTTIVTDIGANRESDEQLAALDLRGNENFSYWAIRKSEDPNADVIAKCYDRWFTFCIMDNYWITPVFEGKVTPDEQLVSLTHLEYSRNRWTDKDGNLYPNGNTDLLYTDFEIAFSDGAADLFGQDSGYQVGVVFELCAKEQDPFVQGTDYGYESDPENLAAAIKNSASSYYYADGKRRSIMTSSIATDKLTNKNRIQFGKAFKNSYKEDAQGNKIYGNSNYLMKATAFMIDSRGNVTFSNSVYICLKDIAAKEQAADDMWLID